MYHTHGVQIGGQGAEDHAPDQTHTGTASASSLGGSGELPKQLTSEPQLTSTTNDDQAGIIQEMNPQEKGEKVGSGDTTHTPPSMIFEFQQPTPESEVAPSLKPNSGLKHPSLLLTLAQVPILQKTFELRPNEIMDITRAVEQADLRAKAIDRRNAMDTGSGSGSGGESEKGEGTKWRGNLHR